MDIEIKCGVFNRPQFGPKFFPMSFLRLKIPDSEIKAQDLWNKCKHYQDSFDMKYIYIIYIYILSCSLDVCMCKFMYSSALLLQVSLMPCSSLKRMGGFEMFFLRVVSCLGGWFYFLGRSHWSERSKRKSDKTKSARIKSLNSWCKQHLANLWERPLYPNSPVKFVFFYVTY